MAIRSLEDGAKVISSHGVWVPGVYADDRAARYAFRFSDDVLDELQQEANVRAGGTSGTITFDDLKARRKLLAEKQTAPPPAPVVG